MIEHNFFLFSKITKKIKLYCIFNLSISSKNINDDQLIKVKILTMSVMDFRLSLKKYYLHIENAHTKKITSKLINGNS